MSASHSLEPQAVTKLSDAQLIRAAKKGDTRAFTTLVKRYEETVYRFAFKMCRDPEKAGETLQDTFINVFRKLDTFDAKSKFSTWLYSIVANNCLMKQRKRKLQSLEDPLEEYDDPSHDDRGSRKQIASTEESPAEIMMTRELQDALDRAIQKLPVDYRVVFVLRDVEGNSNEETAKILKISVEATKSRLRRARAFLRDELTLYLSEGEKAGR